MTATQWGERYLDLVRDVVSGVLYERRPQFVPVDQAWWSSDLPKRLGVSGKARNRLAESRLEIGQRQVLPTECFTEGSGWTPEVVPPGHSMIGLKRLNNLRWALETAFTENVAGDFIECGVWRGGASLYAKAIVDVHEQSTRHVVLADSFRGLPAPSDSYGHDADSVLHTLDMLAIPQTEVRGLFKAFALLDDRVEFLEGWFKDTLPTLTNRTWAVARLDGDMYESTIDALVNLYDNISIGGFILVDDYGAYDACKQACTDFRSERGISDEIVQVDWTGAYWRKSG